MKLRQNLFLRKFLPIWGIIGLLFPVVVVMIFEVKGLLELLILEGVSVPCALLSATIGWMYCSKPHWIPLSINMAVTFCVVATMMAVIVFRSFVWGVILLMRCFPIFILPYILLIPIVNYLILRKRLPS